MSEDFRRWLREDRFNICLTVLSALVPFLLTLALDSAKECDSSYVKSHVGGFIYASQSLFIFLTLWVLINTKNATYKHLLEKESIKKYMLKNCNIKCYNGNETLENAYIVVKRTTEQFYVAWISIWLLWLMYYWGNCLFSFLELGKDVLCMSQFAYQQIFDFISSTFMGVVYIILTVATVNIKQRGLGYDTYWKAFLIWSVAFSFFLVLLILEVSAESRELSMKYCFFLSLFLSFLSAISFVLVLGKFSSNFLRIPRWLLLGLYVYAIVQAYVPFTEFFYDGKHFEKLTNETISNMISVITLLGKFILMLTFSWMANQRRLIFYVIHKSTSIDEVPSMLNELNHKPVEF